MFYRHMTEVPFFWDNHLEKGVILECYGMCGYGPYPHYHIGQGTNPQELLFEANLTPRDKSFLKGLKIKWQGACER